MSDKKPRVLIAVPTYEALKVQTFLCLEALDKTQVDAELSVSHRIIIDRARTAFAEQALREGFDYLLFIDDDMTFEPDALNKLIARQKGIVAGLFFTRVEPSMHLAFVIREQPDGTTQYEKMDIDTLLDAEKAGACIPVDGTGTGFTLIHTDVLRAFREKYPEDPFFRTDNRKGKFMSEDIYFCAMAKTVGVQTWVDTAVKVGHIGEKVYTFDDFQANAEKFKRIVATKKKQAVKDAAAQGG